MEHSLDNYLISKAKHYHETNRYMSKAWLLTATTLFRNNFAVQFEAYAIEKEANNCKEAAKFFRNLFKQFPNNECLWREVQQVVAALRSCHPDDNQVFLGSIYNHLSAEVQQKLLLMTAENEDTMEHCRLMLLLLTKFPATVSQYGSRLVDLLVSAEKHERMPAVNCYRKLLICDLLPLLAATSLNLPIKHLFKLLHKSIEFYLYYVMNRNKALMDLGGTDAVVVEPWTKLFLVLEMVGRKLNWDLSDIFKLPLNKELVWQKIVHLQRLCIDQPKHLQQLLYCSLLLFLYCLHEYCTTLDPATGVRSVLVEVMPPHGGSMLLEPPIKMRKLEPDNIVNTYWTVGDPMIASAIPNFQLAYQCWQLLHSCEYLQRELKKLSGTLGLEPWVSGFLLDLTLYQGSHQDCLRLVSAQEPTPSCKSHLRLASNHFFLGQYTEMLDSMLAALNQWPPQSLAGPMSLVPEARDSQKRHLHFLPMRRCPVLQYCCRLLIAALKCNIAHLSLECDLAMGHLLVLMQLDWPHHEALQAEIVQRIRQRNSFTYAPFTKYVLLPDILDDFMLLNTENVHLEILPPSTNQLLNHRRMSTRGVDKGAREDFKLAMKRQIARSMEPLDVVTVQFLTEQRELVAHSLSSSVA